MPFDLLLGAGHFPSVAGNVSEHGIDLFSGGFPGYSSFGSSYSGSVSAPYHRWSTDLPTGKIIGIRVFIEQNPGMGLVGSPGSCKVSLKLNGQHLAEYQMSGDPGSLIGAPDFPGLKISEFLPIGDVVFNGHLEVEYYQSNTMYPTNYCFFRIKVMALITPY